MERRCPRNTKRSNPESVPAILSWCLAINSCMGVPLRIVIGFWNEPAMIRGLRNALGLELARFRKTNTISYRSVLVAAMPRYVGCVSSGRVFSVISSLPSSLSADVLSVFVRMIHQYYAAVRLLADVHAGRVGSADRKSDAAG